MASPRVGDHFRVFFGGVRVTPLLGDFGVGVIRGMKDVTKPGEKWQTWAPTGKMRVRLTLPGLHPLRVKARGELRVEVLGAKGRWRSTTWLDAYVRRCAERLEPELKTMISFHAEEGDAQDV